MMRSDMFLYSVLPEIERMIYLEEKPVRLIVSKKLNKALKNNNIEIEGVSEIIVDKEYMPHSYWFKIA